MRTSFQFCLIVAFATTGCLLGCGYTIVRNFDEEALQAEIAAIESLQSAPDLTIADIKVEYFPSRGRQYPLDQSASPGRVVFTLTIANIGDADFVRPYLIVVKNLNLRPTTINPFYGAMFNRKREIIAAEGTQKITIVEQYPRDSTTFSFTILTNSIIQHDLVVDLKYHQNNPPIPPNSREFRYDNNEARIRIAGWFRPRGQTRLHD